MLNFSVCEQHSCQCRPYIHWGKWGTCVGKRFCNSATKHFCKVKSNPNHISLSSCFKNSSTTANLWCNHQTWTDLCFSNPIQQFYCIACLPSWYPLGIDAQLPQCLVDKIQGNPRDSFVSKDTHTKLQVLRNAWKVLSLSSWQWSHNISLALWNHYSWKYKKSSCDLVQAQAKANRTKIALRKQRTEAVYSDLYKRAAAATAKTVYVTPEKPRSTTSSRQKHRSNVEVDTAEAYLRKNIFCPFADHITREMERRFPKEVVPILQYS